MYKTQAQRYLAGRIAAFSPLEWSILRAIFQRDDAPDILSLSQQYENAPEETIRFLSARGIAGYARACCPSLASAPQSLQEALKYASARELAICAQRRLAMMQLNERAEKTGIHPIIIKGAANAIVFYPQESTRPSSDIDLLLPREEIELGFAEETRLVSEEFAKTGTHYHLPGFRLAGFPVEAHYDFINAKCWGRYHDIEIASTPLTGFPYLRRPNAEAAATIALLHFIRHGGSFVFDLIDLALIMRSKEFSMDRALAYWREHNLMKLVLPGLLTLDLLTNTLPETQLDALLSEIGWKARQEVFVGLRFLASPRMAKFSHEWFRSRLNPPSFPVRLIRRFWNTPSETQQRTGLHRSHPLFWIHYVFLQPLRRIRSLWK